VLHTPSGFLYLACSTLVSRRHWLPALGVFEEDPVALDDYIATYDPATGAVTRLAFEGFPTPQGYSSHGMDVVPSTSNSTELYVYAINHRRPVQGSGKKVGANSVVEIFKTTVGGNTLTHLKTVEDRVIDTPNDLVGSSDGKSFYFTNDHGAKVGVVSGPHLKTIIAPGSFIPCSVQVL
jgi:arylesterase / paraoxonase